MEKISAAAILEQLKNAEADAEAKQAEQRKAESEELRKITEEAADTVEGNARLKKRYEETKQRHATASDLWTGRSRRKAELYGLDAEIRKNENEINDATRAIEQAKKKGVSPNIIEEATRQLEILKTQAAETKKKEVGLRTTHDEAIQAGADRERAFVEEQDRISKQPVSFAAEASVETRKARGEKAPDIEEVKAATQQVLTERHQERTTAWKNEIIKKFDTFLDELRGKLEEAKNKAEEFLNTLEPELAKAQQEIQTLVDEYASLKGETYTFFKGSREEKKQEKLAQLDDAIKDKYLRIHNVMAISRTIASSLIAKNPTIEVDYPFGKAPQKIKMDLRDLSTLSLLDLEKMDLTKKYETLAKDIFDLDQKVREQAKEKGEGLEEKVNNYRFRINGHPGW